MEVTGAAGVAAVAAAVVVAAAADGVVVVAVVPEPGLAGARQFPCVRVLPADAALGY